MTGTQLMGLALFFAPITGCVWAWIQYHREKLKASPADPEPKELPASAPQQVGVWEQPPLIINGQLTNVIRTPNTTITPEGVF